MAFGAVSRRHFPGSDAMAVELAADSIGIEGFHAEAEVIHVATFSPGRRTAFAAELAIDWHQVH